MRRRSFMLSFLIILKISLYEEQVNAAAAATRTTKTQTINPKRGAICLLPKEPGPCRMKLLRYYFNSATNECEEFTFGGCMGNDNKFGFRETCESACKSTTATKTLPKVDTTKAPTIAAAKPEITKPLEGSNQSSKSTAHSATINAKTADSPTYTNVKQRV